MNNTLKALAIALALSSCGASQKTTTKNNKSATKYAKTITATELKDMLYTYASDEFEGRLTGAKGQKLAVDFIKKHYQDYGIPAAKTDGDYFQKVPLEITKTPTATVLVNGQKFEYKTNFVALNDTESIKIKASEIVYANYGIDDKNYSDYKTINVKNKVVLIKNGEPKNTDGTFLISGTNNASKWSDSNEELTLKKETAIANGAKAVLFYHPMVYAGAVAYFANDDHSKMALKNQNKTPYFLINTSLAKALVTNLETITESKLIKTNFELDLKNNATFVDSENVAAFLEGTEKPEEIIVISAHLDHEGVKDGKIYNGADDDGSGTVAVLEIAEAFAKAKKDGNGPKRSILFLNVTGEEKGLLGSKYYTDIAPIKPLKNTVANLNIDMIGRTDPKRKSTNRNYLYLIGSDKLSSELHAISEKTNTQCCNIELDYTFNDDNDPNQFYYRSDHYNFAKNNIPVIFYFNGTHDDYHQPSDTPDKIQYDLLENRTRLIFYTIWELANRDKRITVDKTASN